MIIFTSKAQRGRAATKSRSISRKDAKAAKEKTGLRVRPESGLIPARWDLGLGSSADQSGIGGYARGEIGEGVRERSLRKG